MGLAPEHSFPKGFDDCVTATKHVLNNGISYGVNPNKIAVGGDSAGGNLAAAVTIKFRDERIEPRIKAQLLIYPSLQVCSHSLPMTKQRLADSADEFLFFYGLLGMWLSLNKHQQEMMESGKYITPELAEKCKRLVDVDLIPANLVQKGYVRDDHVATPIDDDVISMSKLIEDPRVSPLLVEDLSELPPAYVFTVHWDYIRDHGIIYAKRLEKAGNTVVWHPETDTFHGVLNTCHTEPVFKTCPKLIGNITEFLKKPFAE
ncbi:arylacetamide deacetylase-like 3 [Gigantopelta aegis]|uniref:arylacetamide deacetylase-like 3 n=1 Tax=Gigantopelta aegis TaxID=1735272 RepID=UPI001B88CE20|nr:arylacetamide deacetylase-like 3 [Gigantopelta aegis]